MKEENFNYLDVKNLWKIGQNHSDENEKFRRRGLNEIEKQFILDRMKLGWTSNQILDAFVIF